VNLAGDSTGEKPGTDFGIVAFKLVGDQMRFGLVLNWCSMCCSQDARATLIIGANHDEHHCEHKYEIDYCFHVYPTCLANHYGIFSVPNRLLPQNCPRKTYTANSGIELKIRKHVETSLLSNSRRWKVLREVGQPTAQRSPRCSQIDRRLNRLDCRGIARLGFGTT
jgi:hypothetical protein